MTALLSACTTVLLTAANVPAMFAPVRRTAHLAFGPGARDRLDVYQPSTASARPQPVIIFWHGGGWVDGQKSYYRFVGATLAQLGYVTILPNYRVYPEVRFPAFLDDGARAVAWVQQHAADYGGDPHRIVLMGHSAGAHLAAMLAVNHSYLQHAGASTHDIIGLIGLSGPYDLKPNTPVLNTIFSAPYSPRDWKVLPYVNADSPPALLIHGGADTLVWPSNTLGMAAALRAHGVPVETRIYPGRSHADTVAALSVPARARGPVLKDVAEFMKQLSATGAATARPGRQSGLEAAAHPASRQPASLRSRS
ncbi:MAG TPA: alpha/beta hydrolase [Steroidobacteraceae bacterium]|nr:alpha/beta hydrolase [Steroidobacteraceae bacterium]